MQLFKLPKPFLDDAMIVDRLRAGVVTGPYGEGRTVLKQFDKSEFVKHSVGTALAAVR